MTRMLVFILTIGLAFAGLAASAISSHEVFHSFDFGQWGENRGIEFLDWRYGDSGPAFTRAPKEYLATGHIPQSGNAHGMMPVGNSLYVKWRVLSTGKVYEDTVDLKSRLPWNMDHKTIHFFIKGPQLYIYLIYRQGHPGKPDCPITLYQDHACARIYPDHWSNV